VDRAHFVGDLQCLLCTDVSGLDDAAKIALAREQLALFETDRSMLELRLTFVPFIPGRRALDEVKHPGLGSSEAVGLFAEGAPDQIVFLYRLTRGGRPERDLPPNTHVLATIERQDDEGSFVPLSGWTRRPVDPERVVPDEPAGPIPRAWAMRLDVGEELGLEPPGDDPSRPMGFGALFSQRFRVRLDLEVGGALVSADTHDFESFDLASLGSLYRRLIDRLLPLDMEHQDAAGLPPTYHPWFPVLCIGTQKADLYTRAIVGDVVEQKRMLTDPAWLLRVGLYLELLTCLGVIEAVKDSIDLLSPDEREVFEQSPRHAEIRRRIDVAAWKKVWRMRKLALKDGQSATRTAAALQNLMRKKTAVVGFLHAHHEDLKQAIDLAGPNSVNAQETWHRVFRDAERAVLSRSEEAFPELRLLAKPVRGFALWHERGRFGVALPPMVTSILGDQDGIYPSACRQYRASMNHVAEWARGRGLMEYTGAECIGGGVSLLESHLAGDALRLERLQHRDGYEGSLEIRERAPDESVLTDAQIAAGLGAVSIFQVLTDEERNDLARQVRPIRLGPDERIVIEGNRGSSLFLVQEGELEVIAKRNGRETLLAHLGKGAVVGEVSFLTGQVRTATVRATHGAVVLEVTPSHLEPITRARPAVLDQLADLMVERQKEKDPAARGRLLRTLSSAVFGRSSLKGTPSR
jgi:hypothetical protein